MTEARAVHLRAQFLSARGIVVVLVEVLPQVAAGDRGVPILRLEAVPIAQVELVEEIADVLTEVGVRSEAVGLHEVLAEPQAVAAAHERRHRLVADRAFVAHESGEIEGIAIALHQWIELLERRCRRAFVLQHRRADTAQPRRRRYRGDGLQHLRLQQLAHARTLITREQQVAVGEVAVGREAARVEADRAAALGLGELVEAQLVRDARLARGACRLILIEQQARAIDRAVVVELHRAGEIHQRLARLIDGLLADRVVEPGRRIPRVECLRDVELHAGQGDPRRITLVEIGLAHVRAHQRVDRIQGHGHFELLATFGQIAFADLRESQAQARQRIPRRKCDRAFERRARRGGACPCELSEPGDEVTAWFVRVGGNGGLGSRFRFAALAHGEEQLRDARLGERALRVSGGSAARARERGIEVEPRLLREAERQQSAQ